MIHITFRLIAFKLEELGLQYLPSAVDILRRVRKFRPVRDNIFYTHPISSHQLVQEEPQSHLFLANALLKLATSILRLSETLSRSQMTHRMRKNRSLEGDALLHKLLSCSRSVNDRESMPDPKTLAVKYFSEAIGLFNQVILGKWDKR